MLFRSALIEAKVSGECRVRSQIPFAEVEGAECEHPERNLVVFHAKKGGKYKLTLRAVAASSP